MNPEEAVGYIVTAVKEGRVELASEATACLPITKEIKDLTESDFSYVYAEPLIQRAGRHDGGMYFRWGAKGFGFGEVTVVVMDGKWILDDEYMGLDFVKKMLGAWIDRITSA